MGKVILIHANCNDEFARGDYVFAANIAKDMVHELHNNGEQDIDVILVSALDGVPRFINIYGSNTNGRILVEGTSIGLSSLEEFDAVANQVVAFIDANHCKYSAASLVKRVLSPDSKVLFIGNANQIAYPNVYIQRLRIEHFKQEQPGVYNLFDMGDMLVGSAGLGKDRLGLPTIKKTADLTPLTEEEQLTLPQTAYGFSYVNAFNPSVDYQLIAQYFQLSGLDYQILVGNFTDKKSEVESAFHGNPLLYIQKLPHITYYQSLPNRVMRQIVANATSTLILSTGVTSTLEVISDNKLPFYQDIEGSNENFVTSYLVAVQSIVSNDRSLFDLIPKLVIELSNLLFAEKPLNHTQMIRTKELLDLSSTRTNLIRTNQTLMAQANGKIAPRLLSFLNNPRKTNDHIQVAAVCSSLRRTDEKAPPVHDQALRRAATWGRLFELKVLIRSMGSSDINKVDSVYERTALHWAVSSKEYDCTRELIKSGALLNVQDKKGKTALHKAVEIGDRQMIKILIEAGASMQIKDEEGKSPKSCTHNDSLISFINNCFIHLYHEEETQGFGIL